MKKILLTLAIICACGGMINAEDRRWPTTGNNATGTVPDDGNTYYIDAEVWPQTGWLIILGKLEIRETGYLRPSHHMTVQDNGVLEVKGGRLRAGGWTARLWLGYNAGSTATLNIYSGLVEMDLFYSGQGSGSNTTINMYGGTVETVAGGIFTVGWTGTCTFNMYGGTVNLTRGQFINEKSGSTTNLYGGQFNVIDGGLGYTGHWITSGTFNVHTGGTCTITGGALSVAQAGTANFNVVGGTFILDGGEYRSGFNANFVSTSNFNATSGIVQLKSGTFRNGYEVNCTGNINISGSTQFSVGSASIVTGGGPSNIDIFGNDFLVSSGTITNGGTFTIPSQTDFTLAAGSTFINNGNLDVNVNSKLNVIGNLKNRSSSSVNIYGTTYTYSYIENGDGSNPGALNIHYPGNLYLLGAELRNGNAGSAINVNSGGTLHNYQGVVDVTLGNLNLNNGGTFNNVRGNYPATLTPANGGNFFDDDVMVLDQDIDLDYTWTITEKAKLFGNGNKITFGTNGNIVIQGPDAALLLEDVLVVNISGTQIHCTDNTTTLSIDNVTWIQDANYSFTKGILNINGDWHVTGKNTTFAYSSNQVSTLQQDTNWMFDTDVTFSYDSSSPGNIVMTDATAKIHFDGATLHVAKDARFKDGTFSFDNITTLNTETGRTLYFGNNNASENLTLDFHNLSKTIIAGAGTLANQNV